MAHYRMRDEQPSAIITSKNSEMRIYEGNRVFLNDKDNFEIRFFNPLTETIGAEILFNGKQTSKSLLVLKPGQDVILDRFIGEKRKMLFETYNIDGNNEAAVKAAKMNGLIEIKFFKERLNHYFSSINTLNVNSRIYPTNGLIGGTTTNNNFYSSQTLTSDVNYSDYIAENLDKNIAYSEYLCDSTGQAPSPEYKSTTRSFTGSPLKKQTKVETGRIEKGEKSDQKLSVVDMEFESSSFYSVSYLLLPISQQQSVTYTEIRNYCPSCSYRVRKQSWKFCPKCGGEI